MNKTISIIVNVDTRAGFLEEKQVVDVMLAGARSVDFILDGVQNKQAFFRGYDIETILFIDYHNPLPEEAQAVLMENINKKLITSVVFSNHRKYYNERTLYDKWNDLNFLHAMMLARGRYVAKFDGDMAAFRRNDSGVVDWMMDYLEAGACDFISYPTHFSPNPDVNWDYSWASTRFLFFRKEWLDYYFSEIIKCLNSSEYLYGTYGDKKYKCPWLEHIMGIISGKVYYPPMAQDYMIFSWSVYHAGTLAALNNMEYNDVVKYVNSCGGIGYPCDVRGSKI